jgi:Dyp-type peroxidase family
MGAQAQAGMTDKQARNIQGVGIAGFRKDHQGLIGVRIDDPHKARKFLHHLSQRTANAWEVKRFNEEFSEIKRRGGADPEELQSTWVATLIAASGYEKLGISFDGLPAGPGKDAFVSGMAARAATIGDTRPKDVPTQWLQPFQQKGGVDMLLIVAADDQDDLARVCEKLHGEISRSGCSVVFDELGETLPGHLRGHEHFGFKDGNSQPLIVGWDRPPKQGEPPALPLGEFVLGNPDWAGPGPTVGELWAGGSFAVFRRLRQDVLAFRQETASISQTATPALDPPLTPEQVAAKLVGRWPSGAPLATAPDADDKKVTNAFDYIDDEEGLKTPRFAHNRKVNPRHEKRDDLATDPTERHRMLRRGIPFGPPLPTDATTDDGVERGLHFISVIADPVRQFEFVQSNWANNPNFPNGGAPGVPGGQYTPPAPGIAPDGPDPLAGEFDVGASDSLHQPSGLHTLSLAEVVTVSAGEYFFVPSIKALRQLAARKAWASAEAPAASPEAPTPTPGSPTAPADAAGGAAS